MTANLSLTSMVLP